MELHEENFKKQARKLFLNKISILFQTLFILNFPITGGKMTKCHHCDKLFFSFGELQKHIKEAHTGMKCKFCGKMFIQIDDLKAHTQKVHGKGYVTKGNINTLPKPEEVRSKPIILSKPGVSKAENSKPEISKEENFKTKDSDELTQDQVVKTVDAKNVSFVLILLF